MPPITISCIVFSSVFGGSIIGMGLRRRLPKDHLSDESKSIVQLGMGLVATMTALVLALLIASAKNSHDLQNEEVIEISVDFMQLDRTVNAGAKVHHEAGARMHHLSTSSSCCWTAGGGV